MRALAGVPSPLVGHCTCQASTSLSALRGAYFARLLPPSAVAALGQQLRLVHTCSPLRHPAHPAARARRSNTPRPPWKTGGSSAVHKPAARQHAGPRPPARQHAGPRPAARQHAVPARQPVGPDGPRKGSWANGAPKLRRPTAHSSAAAGVLPYAACLCCLACAASQHTSTRANLSELARAGNVAQCKSRHPAGGQEQQTQTGS